MTTTGPNYPGTAANVDRAAGLAWSNTGSIATDDASYATVGTDVNTDYLVASNFGFSIPAGSIIDGILMELVGKTSRVGTYDDGVVSLTKDAGSSFVGDNKADAALNWTAADQARSYGSSSDDWNAGLTADDVNASGFGIALAMNFIGQSATISVDYMRLTVTYTPAPAGDGWGIPIF